MRYTVVWTQMAQDHLTNLWLQASDQQAIADAANALDRALANDPDSKGRPRGRFFVIDSPPLSVLYEIVPDDRLVRVHTVKRI